jgi:lysophospholipase L1-like esterase
MKRLLCYGDSNTWGQRPFVWEKYPENLIWTSLVENRGGVIAINEGLCGRTAGDIDFGQPFYNGLSHFLSHAYSKWPFDAILIALGTNDLQARFERSAQQIFSDLIGYVSKINFMKDEDRIRLSFMTPPMLIKEIGRGESFEGADKKVIELRDLLIQNQNTHPYSVIDISGIEVKSEDGVHFSLEEHERVAEEVIKHFIA